MRGGINVQKAARVLVDAVHLGDKSAAKKHRCSVRTVERWRAAQGKNEKLAALVRKILEHDDAQMRPKRVALAQERAEFQSEGLAFARAVMAKGTSLLGRCTTTQFPELAAAVRDVSEAIRNVGEIDLAAELLGVGNRDRQPDPPAPEAGGAAPDESKEGDGDDAG